MVSDGAEWGNPTRALSEATHGDTRNVFRVTSRVIRPPPFVVQKIELQFFMITVERDKLCLNEYQHLLVFLVDVDIDSHITVVFNFAYGKLDCVHNLSLFRSNFEAFR